MIKNELKKVQVELIGEIRAPSKHFTHHPLLEPKEKEAEAEEVVEVEKKGNSSNITSSERAKIFKKRACSSAGLGSCQSIFAPKRGGGWGG